MRFSFFLPVLALAYAVLAAPALAAETYTVSDIHVDVSASSSTEAFTSAIAGGRPRAFQILFRRLTRQQDWPRQPVLDAAGLTRISRGYNVANERRSTTRYVADVTYIFNPDAVARLLRGANIAFTQGLIAQRILVVAMSPGVTATGPWAQALAAPSLQGAVVPFTLAGADDVKPIAALNFDAASWSDVAAAAAKLHANEAALVQAVYANGKITVNIRRLGPNQAPVKTSTEVAMLSTLSTAYPMAAQAAAAAIDDLWKTRAAIDYSQRNRLTADMLVSGIAQWGQAQSALAAVPLVTGVTLVAMDTGYARLQIAYTGTTEQLREALGAQHLALTGKAGQWMLAAQ